MGDFLVCPQPTLQGLQLFHTSGCDQGMIRVWLVVERTVDTSPERWACVRGACKAGKTVHFAFCILSGSTQACTPPASMVQAGMHR
jgi:hypothetical protein